MSDASPFDADRSLRAHMIVIRGVVRIDLLRQEICHNGHSYRIPMPCLRTLLAFHSVGFDNFTGVGVIARLTGMKVDSAHVYICDLRRWLAFHGLPISIRHLPARGYYLSLEKEPSK